MINCLRKYLMCFCFCLYRFDVFLCLSDRKFLPDTFRFPKLTDKYFQKQRWPTADDIASLVQNGEWKSKRLLVIVNKKRNDKKKKCPFSLFSDEVVIILYKELYYRHIYAHNIQSGPSLDERFESYMNYIALFNLILSKSLFRPVTHHFHCQFIVELSLNSRMF